MLFSNREPEIIFSNSDRLLINLQRALPCVYIHPHPVLLSPMSRKVIHWDFHTLALLELAQDVCQQIKVKGIGVVKVIVITGGQTLLFCRQDLRITTVRIGTIYL